MAKILVAVAVFDEEDEGGAIGEGDFSPDDGVDAELAGVLVEADGAGEGVAVRDGGSGHAGGVGGVGEAFGREGAVEEGIPAMGVEGGDGHSVSIYSIAPPVFGGKRWRRRAEWVQAGEGNGPGFAGEGTACGRVGFLVWKFFF